MPAKPPALSVSQQRLLTDLGERLRMARLRRRHSMKIIASRSSISRMTLQRAEKGSAAVSLGVYLQILSTLNLEGDLSFVAADDKQGRDIQDAALPARRRQPKKVADDVNQNDNEKELQIGDRVQAWVWTNDERGELQPLVVVSVSPETIVCRTEFGIVKQIPKHEVSKRDWTTASGF